MQAKRSNSTTYAKASNSKQAAALSGSNKKAAGSRQQSQMIEEAKAHEFKNFDASYGVANKEA